MKNNFYMVVIDYMGQKNIISIDTHPVVINDVDGISSFLNNLGFLYLEFDIKLAKLSSKAMMDVSGEIKEMIGNYSTATGGIFSDSNYNQVEVMNVINDENLHLLTVKEILIESLNFK